MKIEFIMTKVLLKSTWGQKSIFLKVKTNITFERIALKNSEIFIKIDRRIDTLISRDQNFHEKSVHYDKPRDSNSD